MTGTSPPPKESILCRVPAAWSSTQRPAARRARKVFIHAANTTSEVYTAHGSRHRLPEMGGKPSKAGKSYSENARRLSRISGAASEAGETLAKDVINSWQCTRFKNIENYPGVRELLLSRDLDCQSGEAIDRLVDDIVSLMGPDDFFTAINHLAGEVGIDPGPFTVRELVEMAEGKRKLLQACLAECVKTISAEARQLAATKGDTTGQVALLPLTSEGQTILLAYSQAFPAALKQSRSWKTLEYQEER